MRFDRFFCMIAALSVVTAPAVVKAAPYASGVTNNGSTVSFILNEPADSLTYRVNGGPVQVLDHTTKGLKSFSVTSVTDLFEISAEKIAPVGYTTLSTGTIIPTDCNENGVTDATGADAAVPAGNCSTAPAPKAGFNVISDDNDLKTRFFNQRGIDVSTDPNAPNFGTVYISVAGTTDPTPVGSPAIRTITRGIHALGADGSDILGNGDNGANPVLPDTFPAFVAGQSNSPFRVQVAGDGNVYVTDWSDANGTLFRINPNLTSAINVLQDFGGPTALPPGRNHGSVAAAWIEGSQAGGDLEVFTLDEDLTTSYVTGSGSTTDRFSMWRYDIDGGALPHAGLPTKLGPNMINGTQDLDRGADGKFYLSQNRFAGTDAASVFVTDPAGAVIWDSLTASRALLGNPSAPDVLNNTFGGVAVSEDQQWMATLQNFSNIMVVPLVDGIPDLAGRMVVSTGEHINSGRGITFDAAGNIHYVSSGQARYRQLAPGGHTLTTLSWDGTNYSFESETIDEPGDLIGDFNKDGSVDAADYVMWMKDNSVGDYNDWVEHFGETLPPGGGSGSGAVPEPGTAVLAVVSLLIAGFAGRRRA